MGNKPVKNKNLRVLDEETITALIENTSFTREEILEWHKAFIKDCGTVGIDKKQFIEAYKVLYPLGKADKYLNRVLKLLASDDINTIDFSSFLTTISLAAPGDCMKKLKLIFKMSDISKNGTIEIKELVSMIEAIYDLHGEEYKRSEDAPYASAKAIMIKLDTDQNGCLTEDEFVKGKINLII